MKKSTVKHFHTRLILALAGAAVFFLGSLEFVLSKSILALFISGFGYSTMLIGIWALNPRHSLLRKITTSFASLFLIMFINWLLILFIPSTSLFVPPNFSWFLMLQILLGASLFHIIFQFSLPTTLQNLLKLLTFRNIRGLIVSFLAVYILFIFFFALCYATIYKFIPDSFEASQSLSFFDITYYSVVTITTLGYGDIRALHWVSKLLSIIEVIVGLGLVVIYVGITAAILLREKERRI